MRLPNEAKSLYACITTDYQHNLYIIIIKYKGAGGGGGGEGDEHPLNPPSPALPFEQPLLLTSSPATGADHTHWSYPELLPSFVSQDNIF